MLNNLEQLSYHAMTEIQAASLPAMLAGEDVIAQAKTGSGKTAAFGLSLLMNLDVKRWRVQSLVLCPTRELADQVAKELRKLARFQHNIKILTLCGGMPIGPQFGSLEHGAHIVVGTPGRLLKHCRKGSLDLENINTLVLDEADRMLDMGFSEDVEEIISHTPQDRQTLLFSATYPDGVASMSARVQKQPKSIRVSAVHEDRDLTQMSYLVDRHDREAACVRLLQHYDPESTLIFCNTKQQCAELAHQLKDQHISASALHGDLDQRDRDQVLLRFANNSCSVLVATDVAARGLDIKKLDCVINYDLSHDPEVHVHRIGRTGRAGEKGLALNIFTDRENNKMRAIEELMDERLKLGDWQDLETYTLSIEPKMATISFDAGKKQKLRAGDILGVLTKTVGLSGDQVGKIDIFDFAAYVAVEKSVLNSTLKKLQDTQIKGKRIKTRKITR